MPKFKIRHITRYTYDQPVRDSANQIMLYPIEDIFQQIAYHKIVISADPQIALHSDYFGNKVGSFTYIQPHRELVIDSRVDVITTARELHEPVLGVREQWEAIHKMLQDIEFIDFLRQEHFGSLPEMERIITDELSRDCAPLEVAKDLTTYVYNNFKYQKGVTTVETTPDEIWKIKSGVCQDFAHVLLVMLRIMKIPARYVSGYICPNKNGMRGEGATHAWVEAFFPEMGWVGLDPTNNCVVRETHVRLAVGKDFSDCSPVRGTYRGTAANTMEVVVTVEYEGGQGVREHVEPLPTSSGGTTSISSYSKNSFHRHQEMQMQQ